MLAKKAIDEMLFDSFSSCLVTIALQTEEAGSIFESNEDLFDSIKSIIEFKSNPFLQFSEEEIKTCTREQTIALYFSRDIMDYPVEQMQKLLKGSDVQIPRTFIFFEDESIELPAEWLRLNRIIIGKVPTTHQDEYYPIFREPQRKADVYYYKSPETKTGKISPFVRIVESTRFNIEQFMDLVLKMYSPKVYGTLYLGDNWKEADVEFPGWVSTDGCSDLQLSTSTSQSAIVAMNYTHLTTEEYEKYERGSTSEIKGKSDAFVKVFASNWKVEILSTTKDFDEEKLKRFFNGKVLPKTNSAYGFWVYDCVFTLINGVWKLHSISKRAEGEVEWVKKCLLDVLPEIRIVRVEYGPSNKTYRQFIELTARSEVMNYVANGKAWSRKKSGGVITQAQLDSISNEENRYHHWFLVDREDNLLCYAAILINKKKYLENEVRIISRVPRKGYARRAVIFISNFFQATANNQRSLIARVNSRNEASARLFDSLYPSWKRTSLLFGVIHYNLERGGE